MLSAAAPCSSACLRLRNTYACRTNPCRFAKSVKQLKAGLSKLVASTEGRRRKQNRLRAAGSTDTESVLAEVGLPDYLPIVRQRDRLAAVCVNIGTVAANPGRNGRLANLSLFFGRTEITAVASAASTGEQKEVTEGNDHHVQWMRSDAP